MSTSWNTHPISVRAHLLHMPCQFEGIDSKFGGNDNTNFCRVQGQDFGHGDEMLLLGEGKRASTHKAFYTIP